MIKLKTFVYVDGYNFYYRSLKGTKYKWLDLGKFLTALLPNNEILHINYYTAKAQPQPFDPDVGKRQNEYLRALGTIKNLAIHFGQFRSHPSNQPLYDSCLIDGHATQGKIPVPDRDKERVRVATILKTEEKGSDVNLASHLVYNGCRKHFEAACVFSNDSDLAEPVRLVATELKLKIYVYNKDTLKNPAQALKRYASGFYNYRDSDLAAAQFPATLNDLSGRPIAKPTNW